MANGKKQQQRTTRVERFKGGKIRPGRLRHTFTRFASWASDRLGSHWAFVIAISVIVVWALSGPLLGFDHTWMLIINTVTTIVTFLMVFVIQNTQTRETKAIHLKLDELLRAVPQARDEFMEAEEEDLDEILREKEIVDRADPTPPAHKETAERTSRHEKRRAG